MNEMCISNIKNGKYFLSVFLRLYLVCSPISSYRNLNYVTVVYAGVEELSTVASASCRRGTSLQMVPVAYRDIDVSCHLWNVVD